MRGMKKYVVIAALAAAVMLGWQAGNCAFADLQLQGEMRDMSRMPGSNWGYAKYRTDDDFREAVIKKAGEYGIDLKPEQVTVQRDGSVLYLAADYSVPVNVATYTVVLHFTPSSTKNYF